MAEPLGQIQKVITKISGRLFRNNVGVFTTDRGTKIRTGLCKGSSDLIGWVPIKVTPQMVGKTVAIFTAVEVKNDGGRPTDEQSAFLEAVNSAGGYGILSHGPQETLDLIRVLM